MNSWHVWHIPWHLLLQTRIRPAMPLVYIPNATYFLFPSSFFYARHPAFDIRNGINKSNQHIIPLKNIYTVNFITYKVPTQNPPNWHLGYLSQFSLNKGIRLYRPTIGNIQSLRKIWPSYFNIILRRTIGTISFT